MKINAKFIKLSVIFIAVFFLIIVTLFSEENVILNDNGDYSRVIRLCSLEKSADGEFRIVLTGDNFIQNLANILFTPYNISTYPSSQLIFTRVSVAINFIINSLSQTTLHNYNIFYFGLLMSIFYTLALSFFLSQISFKNKRLGILAILTSIIILCDIGYVSYFNSFYAEGLQHILLILISGFVVILTKRKFKIFEVVLFVLTVVLYGQSKFFNIPIAVIIAFVFFLLSFRHCLNKKEIIINSTAVVMVMILLFGTMILMPKWIKNETNYNSVFYGIVKDCTDEEARDYLENDLGLNPELYVLKNTNHYVSNFAEIEKNYNVKNAEEISRLKLVLFYFKHPLVALRKVSDISQHCGVIRNIFFMNEKYMNDPQRLSFWSNLREISGFDTFLVNLLIIIMFMWCVIYSMRNSKTHKYIIVMVSGFILMIFAYSFIIPYVSNGEGDLAKHMYTFIEFVDLALIFILVTIFNSKKNPQIFAALILAIAFIVTNISWSKDNTISFGGYDWYVIEETDNYKTLLSKDIVDVRSFNEINDNHYEKSDIHKWLNEDFLNKFSPEEKELLYFKEEKIILSRDYVNDASFGTRDFYCCAFPKKVESNYDTAYSKNVSAYVFLPSARHISEMAKKGYNVLLKEKYWLSTPYFNNSQKQRYVNPDGLVYFDFTSEEAGIRPVIYLKSDK